MSKPNFRRLRKRLAIAVHYLNDAIVTPAYPRLIREFEAEVQRRRDALSQAQVLEALKSDDRPLLETALNLARSEKAQ